MLVLVHRNSNGNRRAAYVDRPEASTVAGRHVGVESLDGIGSGQLTVLLVHVVCTRARVVADPDTEVLDLQGVLLRDLCQRVSLLIPQNLDADVHTTLTETISPVAFLTLRRPRRKYQ